MKRFWGHRWAIGFSALVLVLALGAVAWAATDDAATEQASPTPGAGNGPGPMFGLEEGDEFGFGGGRGGFMGRGQHHGMMDPENLPEDFQQRMEERRQQMQERRDAFLDLVRQKMSDQDKQSLDSLLDQADTKREALDQAREDLQETTGQIRDLVGKYYPLGTGADGSGTSTTTQPETTEQ